MSVNRRSFLQTSALAGAAIAASPSKPSSAQSAGAYEDILTVSRKNRSAVFPALSQPTGQKIVKIETFTQGGTLSVVRVETGDGAEGWGQISTYDADLSAQILHRKVAHHALGKDPADLELIADRVIEANHKYPWSYVCRALGGLETALWDWHGRKQNKTVCELLGGTPRPLPVYGSSMRRDITPKDEADRLVKLHDELGYAAFKARVGVENGRDRDQWEGRSEELIPTLRKALGDKIELLADGNSGYTPPRAIEIGRMLEERNYIQFEEPCPYWELEWTRDVADALSVPVSGGEQDNDLAQWRRMIEMGAVDIVQPDILYVGGILRAWRVAMKAAERKIPCVPHSANRAMVTVFTLHLFGAIPNAGRHVEYSIEPTPWAENFFEPLMKVVDGKVMIPNAEPGWGVHFRRDWLEKAERETREA